MESIEQSEPSFAVPLYFWQNMPSMHQSATIKALARISSASVTWVVDTLMEPNSKASGWALPDFGAVRLVEHPSEDEVNQIVKQSGPNAVHFIASDLFIYPHIKQAFEAVKSAGGRIVFTSESRDSKGKTGLLRRLRYTWFGYRNRSKIDSALIFGFCGVHGGRNYFSRAGFSDSQLFPFAYLMEPVVKSEIESEPGFKIVCLAQLIDRKGIDILLSAAALLKDVQFQLEIIGRGEREEVLRKQIVELGLEKSTEILGALPHEQAMAKLSSADLLVLPSRFDGWGAVINEALMRGIPAISTDRCGAQDLIRSEWRGSVAEAENVESLASCMRSWIQRGKLPDDERNRIRNWSSCISGESGATYLISILQFLYENSPRPEAPWLIE